MSRTGRTGIRRIPVATSGVASWWLVRFGWFCIECPLINFSSLDNSKFEKVANSASWHIFFEARSDLYVLQPIGFRSALGFH